MKYIALSIICFISLNCFAQKHMRFMGILIDGDAYSFGEQLKAKGFSKSSEETETTNTYLGKFYDEEAYIDVTFDRSNKIVYEVNVSIVKKFAFELTTIQKDIMRVIEDKYIYKKEVVDANLHNYEYCVFDGNAPIGVIRTFLIDTSLLKPGGESMLTISYVDAYNYMKCEERKRRDI